MGNKDTEIINGGKQKSKTALTKTKTERIMRNFGRKVNQRCGYKIKERNSREEKVEGLKT